MLNQCCMTPVETFTEARECCEYPQCFAFAYIKIENFRIFFLWSFFPVKPCNISHETNFFLIETEKFWIFYDIVGVCMMIGIGYERSDIMEKCCIFKQFAFRVPEIMELQRFSRVEELKDQTCYRAGMDLIDPTWPSELKNTALAGWELTKQRKGIHPREVINQQAVLQPPTGNRDSLKWKLFHKYIKNRCTRYDDICTVRIHTRYFLSLRQG